MRYLPQLFENNRRWSEERRSEDPVFFERQAHAQTPRYLWIGCADSRVPANEIVGLAAGELFVHRNVANVVAADDLNLMSVLQYAVDFLKVAHVIVCGHYGCGGVQAALGDPVNPPLEQWVEHIRRVRRANGDELAVIADETLRWRRLCELNVIAQVGSVCDNEVVQAAWRRGQELVVHGWIYDLRDGLLHDLDVSVNAIGMAPAQRYS